MGVCGRARQDIRSTNDKRDTEILYSIYNVRALVA